MWLIEIFKLHEAFIMFLLDSAVMNQWNSCYSIFFNLLKWQFYMIQRILQLLVSEHEMSYML